MFAFQPHSAEVDFTEFLGDGDDSSKEALSDNDEQTKKSSFKVKVSNDTRSDDGIDLTQVQDTENSEVQEMPTVNLIYLCNFFRLVFGLYHRLQGGEGMKDR